jgi:hypothetical protein
MHAFRSLLMQQHVPKPGLALVCGYCNCSQQQLQMLAWLSSALEQQAAYTKVSAPVEQCSLLGKGLTLRSCCMWPPLHHRLLLRTSLTLAWLLPARLQWTSCWRSRSSWQTQRRRE